MEPEFLDLADVLLIHEEQLARHGGSAGLRDHVVAEESLPAAVRARISDEGVYAYFRHVEKGSSRRAIRDDWRRWLAAHPGCR